MNYIFLNRRKSFAVKSLPVRSVLHLSLGSHSGKMTFMEEGKFDERGGRVWPSSRSGAWTYFIQVVSADGPIKIGKAVNIGERMRCLQGGNHMPLRFLGALPFDEVAETDLHKVFRAWHIRGEWFAANDALYRLADLAYDRFAGGYQSPRGRHDCPIYSMGAFIARLKEPTLDDLVLMMPQVSSHPAAPVSD